MKFVLEEHGDALERGCASVIRQRLPNYAPLWEQFIGNDGSSHLPLQNRLDAKTAARRSTLSRYTYTALESFLSADELAESAQDLLVEEFGKPGAIKSYLNVINHLIAFFAHAGRIRDCASRLANEWKDPELDRSLDEYYGRRNNVLHSAKLPMAISNGVAEVAIPQGRDLDANKWSTDCRWEDAGEMKREVLAELLRSTRDELAVALDSMYARIYAEHVSAHLKDVRAVLNAMADLAQPGIFPVSGTTATATSYMTLDPTGL